MNMVSPLARGAGALARLATCSPAPAPDRFSLNASRPRRCRRRRPGQQIQSDSRRRHRRRTPNERPPGWTRPPAAAALPGRWIGVENAHRRRRHDRAGVEVRRSTVQPHMRRRRWWPPHLLAGVGKAVVDAPPHRCARAGACGHLTVGTPPRLIARRTAQRVAWLTTVVNELAVAEAVPRRAGRSCFVPQRLTVNFRLRTGEWLPLPSVGTARSR